ncbi:hypothetical protein KDN24_06965 [Bacillus sp. Bva_UNVM-123]|uniref:hypothetical protein n=1 Tax=Bacillus sp. Bva_UNVM-123 TaxID=2829798 RepID=UPI00391F9853
MVRIIEIHYAVNNKDKFQSRIIEEDSFEIYKENIIKDGNSKLPNQSIPRHCKVENMNSGEGWLECEFTNPFHSAKMKHIAWELTLNEDKIIKFENGGKIHMLEPSNDVVRGYIREFECDFTK